MSSRKISQLPAASAVTDDDLVAIVDDPTGTPETKKATISQVASNIIANTALTTRLLPAGGSNTYVLAKQSGTDYDVTWVPQSNAILPVTTAQRNALAPYVGLVVYNTDDDRLQVWDGSIWRDAGETFFAALTTAQRNALTPYPGQTILNTDNGQVQTWNGTDWIVSTGVPAVTTAERNALTPYTGQIVYNTDDSRVQYYNGASWQNLGQSYFEALTTAQRNALTPFVGQTIFNTDDSQVQTYNGSDWIVSTGIQAVTTAERNALTPYIGQIVYNTDDNRIQVYDGSVWNNVGQSFFEPLTTAQRNALTPFAGQTIYNTDDAQVQTYDGANWIPSTGIPAYTTAQRNALTPYLGQAIFNTDDDRLQVYDGSQWRDVGETYFQALTTAQRNALTPFTGQTIFNTDTNGLEVYDGVTWLGLSIPSLSTLADVDVTGLSPGDVLAWNSVSGFWEPFTLPDPAIENVHDYGTITTNTNIDLTLAPVQTVELGGNVTLTITNAPSSAGIVRSVLLLVQQDVVGSRSITWSGVDRWFNEVDPTGWAADEERAITLIASSTEVRAFVVPETV